MLFPAIPFAVIALHLFGCSTVPVSVEVNCDERHAGRSKLVAFSQDGSFCFLLFKAQRRVLANGIVLHVSSTRDQVSLTSTRSPTPPPASEDRRDQSNRVQTAGDNRKAGRLSGDRRHKRYTRRRN